MDKSELKNRSNSHKKATTTTTSTKTVKIFSSLIEPAITTTKTTSKNERLERSLSDEPDILMKTTTDNNNKNSSSNESINKSLLNTPNFNKINDKKNNYLTTKNGISSSSNSTTKLINENKQKLNSKLLENKNNEEIRYKNNNDELKNFVISFKIDLVSILLFAIAFGTRLYRLATPNNIVFDELHYGKYVSLYMKNIFFFDQHPPLGKQLVAGLAHLTGYNGNYTFSKIGSEYTSNVPIFWLRLIPAVCGSLLSPTVYKILLEVKLNRWTALLGGLLIILDNSLLTQSRFILMESMLLLFSSIGLLYLLRFQSTEFATPKWLAYGLISSSFFTFALSVKYVGIYAFLLGFFLMARYLWNLLYDANVSDLQIVLEIISRWILFTIIPFSIYISIFYVHLNILYKAGPHDSAMTSAFQASLDGGLASITEKQPLNIAHGSQITLRHTHGRTCWMHSHDAVYPVRYKNKRGSSHQQQVTCYSFKDVNNWWIIKRPDSEDLVVGDIPEPIKHGDVIQLVHGISSRGLNTHDVAAAMTPHSQEVSCYIDYNISMTGQLLWKLDIINRDSEGDIWHAIRSEIRLIHEGTNTALKFSGRQLPDWGFNQHEIIADKNHEDTDTIWNVEEHRYTKTEDQKERERQLLNAEMIPTKRTHLTFWQKFIELQMKMLSYSDPLSQHMYSSETYEWPLLDKGIAYWVDKNSNGQIYLLGNILLWYSGTLSLVLYLGLFIFYLIRRRRLCYDIPQTEWVKFTNIGEIFFIGYMFHYLPYFFIDRTLFLHNYLPAFLFKLLLLCYVFEHLDCLISNIISSSKGSVIFRLSIVLWLLGVIYVYIKFLSISYGIDKLTSDEIIDLRWKDTWDFILHKDLP